MQALLGVPLLLGLAWLFAEKHRPFMWRVVIGGLLLQLSIGILLLKWPPLRRLFEGLSWAFVRVLDFSQVGAQFLFGNLVRPEYAQTSDLFSCCKYCLRLSSLRRSQLRSTT